MTPPRHLVAQVVLFALLAATRADAQTSPALDALCTADQVDASIIGYCASTRTSLGVRAQTALLEGIARMPRSTRRAALVHALFPHGEPPDLGAALREWAWGVTFQARTDAARRCDAMRFWCIERAPYPDALAPDCVASLACVTPNQRDAVLAQLVALPQGGAGRQEVLRALLYDYGIGNAETRARLGPVLIAGGVATRATLARVPPYPALVRAVHRAARRRGLTVTLCERDLTLEPEAPPGTITLVADGNRCPDGPYLAAIVTLGPRGRRIHVERRHTD